MKPYYILGVALDADDETIRKAYLKAVQKAGPESNPRRFQAIHEAYARIKDEDRRNTDLLQENNPPGLSPIDSVLQVFSVSSPPEPLSYQQQKTRLRNLARLHWKKQ